jgi:uncharacterized repeat protein (TIGR01451 family)
VADFDRDGRPDIVVTNFGSSTFSIFVNAAPATTDLAVSMADAPDPVMAGASNLTYTITVTNNGPAAATGVTVTDPLPVQSVFVSATPSVGACSGTTTITCGLGALSSLATATITIVVTPEESASMSNTVTVTGNAVDSNLANNSATAATTVSSAALSFPVTVTVRGSGTGKVTSTPSGVNCSLSSIGSFLGMSVNTPVTLIADPGPGSRFKSWSGVCAGAGTTCHVTLTGNIIVTATFAAILIDDPVTSGVTSIKGWHISQLRTAIDRVRASVSILGPLPRSLRLHRCDDLSAGHHGQGGAHPRDARGPERGPRPRRPHATHVHAPHPRDG